MSYTNGVGSPQQVFGATEAGASSGTSRTARTALSSASTSVQESLSSSTPVDEAKLSATASVVAQAMAGSDVRAEKVAALQQSIAAGTYNVSSLDVAAKVFSALLN